MEDRGSGDAQIRGALGGKDADSPQTPRHALAKLSGPNATLPKCERYAPPGAAKEVRASGLARKIWPVRLFVARSGR